MIWVLQQRNAFLLVTLLGISLRQCRRETGLSCHSASRLPFVQTIRHAHPAPWLRSRDYRLQSRAILFLPFVQTIRHIRPDYLGKIRITSDSGSPKINNWKAKFPHPTLSTKWSKEKQCCPGKNGEGEGSLVNAMRCTNTNKPRTMEGGCQGDDLRGAATRQCAQLCNAR